MMGKTQNLDPHGAYTVVKRQTVTKHTSVIKCSIMLSTMRKNKAE